MQPVNLGIQNKLFAIRWLGELIFGTQAQGGGIPGQGPRLRVHYHQALSQVVYDGSQPSLARTNGILGDRAVTHGHQVVARLVDRRFAPVDKQRRGSHGRRVQLAR